MSTRGQTTLDFLIGTSVFLIAIVLILAFVPGIIDPFTAGTEGHSVTANRAAATLTESTLAEPDEPYILNKSTTDTFFTKDTDAIKSQLGLDPDIGINMTLANSTVTLDSVGPEPPTDRSVTSAWRVVSYDGKRAELTIRVW